MAELTPLVNAQHGRVLPARADTVRMLAGYGRLTGCRARNARVHDRVRYRIGEGLVGQAADQRSPILVEQAPTDYLPIASGLGAAPPATR